MLLALLDQRFEISSEFLDARGHRSRARIAEYANGLARHVVADLEERVEIFRSSVAGNDPLEDLSAPGRALAALRALRAALMREEPRGARDELHQILRVVHDD